MSIARGLVGVVAAAGAVLGGALVPSGAGAATPAAPVIRHVFTIVLENEDFARTFGTGQVESPYFSRTLVQQGAFVPNYYGTGHSSLDNYIAMTSGQGPNPDTQGDCHDPSTIGDDGTLHFDDDGQAIGTLGCTYPSQVDSIGTQLSRAKFTWKGYMQDMDAQPGVQRTTCRGPYTENVIEHPVPAGAPKPPDDYKDKHNPFVYYHSIFDNLSYCDHHDVPFTSFVGDIQQVKTTPNYSFIVPNQCDDGHDMPNCSDGTPGGPSRYDAFLQKYIPLIQASAAYKQDGLIVILFDEGVTGMSCCNEKTSPMMGSGTNSGFPVPGPAGAGGGQTGALLLSPFIKPGTVSTVSYNHYSYLRSMEDIFGLPHIGYAAQDGLTPFGPDIFTAMPSGGGGSSSGPPLPTGTVDIGHRGAAAYAPEETTASYDLARRMGADYLEQDLHLTSDGNLVAIHDDTLDRTARGSSENCTGVVWTKSLAQLKTCDMGSWFNDAHPDLANKNYVGLRILTLDEIIDRYGTNSRYYIETKSPEAQPGMEDALLATLTRHGLIEPARSRRQVLIQSFSPDSLLRIHQTDPALPLIQLTEGGGPAITAAAFAALRTYAVGVGPPSSDVDDAFVAAAHGACLDVHPYTVDDPVEIEAMLDAGVDGMFTNAPDRVRAAIDHGHQTPPAHCR